MSINFVLIALLLAAPFAHAKPDCAKRAKEIFRDVARLEKLKLDEKTFAESARGVTSETKAKHYAFEIEVPGKKYGYLVVLEAAAEKCELVTLERQSLPPAGP